ncbi:MAG: phosphoesterase [Bacteroidetes bacterium]|nr:MAG: phosphoesterase [Bacteroidota bacterium]
MFFTSDQHFGHKNIIKYSGRPFQSVDEMNEVLIQRWNEKIGPDDKVYHLGDFAFTTSEKETREILDRLNGKIYLVKGNHDKLAVACRDRFEWVKDYYELTVKDDSFKRGKQLVVLFHYAIREWKAKHRGSYQLYGHSHGTLPDDPNALAFDIGVDCHDFYPLSWEDVKKIMKEKTWKPPFAEPR